MSLLNLVLTLLSFGLIAVMLLTFRKARTTTAKKALVSIGISLIFLFLYLGIIGTTLSTLTLIIIALVGAGLGFWQGRNTKVWLENGKNKVQNTIWFLVVWAFCYGFNQILVALGQTLSLSLGIASISLGTGVTIGSQGMILSKLNRPPSIGRTTCPHCKASVMDDRQFCTQCGRELIRVCPGCGEKNQGNRKFCSQCGKQI